MGGGRFVEKRPAGDIMSMTDGDEESKLLTNLEGAMQSARNLGLRDLELILKMAVLEVLNYHASQAPTPRAVRGRVKSG